MLSIDDERLSKFSKDKRPRFNPSGFRLERGCTDKMRNLRRTLGQRWSFQQATVMRFIDFASRLGSVSRGFTRQWNEQFYCTVAKYGLYE